MPDASAIRRIAIVSVAFLIVRIATAALLTDPAYTDSYYFTDVALRLAHGQGLTADFLWSPIEAPDLASFALPVASHLFWVPLATVLGAIGIAVFGSLADALRAAQAPFLLLALLVPAAAFIAARSLGASDRAALLAATVAGMGSVLAPFVVAVDAIAPAALIGTAFFLAYARAASGSVRAGVLAGTLVGLLYLTRSEGALFGLALLALVLSPRARAAGVAGAVVALAIGGAWFARDLATGVPTDLFARSALLVRYEDLFAYAPGYWSGQADFWVAKAGALVTNAITFAFVFALVPLIPLAAGLRTLWARADVRAWGALALLVYLAQSLVWTLHSTRGSYLHSLAAFFPFGIALATVGAEQLLASRGRDAAVAWTWGTLLVVAVVSAGAVLEVDGGLAETARARAAAVDAIPAGPFLAVDAAAWRWIADRPVVVTPADGMAYAGCLAALVHARAFVLEAAHFSRYDDLYNEREHPPWLGAPITRGTIKIFPITGELGCSTAHR